MGVMLKKEHAKAAAVDTADHKVGNADDLLYAMLTQCNEKLHVLSMCRTCVTGCLQDSSGFL